MIIGMAVWNTPENGRIQPTRKTINSIYHRVNFDRHRVVIVDNGSTCPDTKRLLDDLAKEKIIHVLRLPTNIGTARAINKVWQMRRPGETAGKMDNDVVVYHDDWPDIMEDVFAREPKIGIVSLKRRDLWESPSHPEEQWRSKMAMLPHQPGQRWITVEIVHHAMGTCQAYNPLLLDKIGYLDQGDSKYGFDDSIASFRSNIAGFVNAFIVGIDIEHVDNNEKNYTQWKVGVAKQNLPHIDKVVEDLKTGKRPLYCPPDGMPW